MKRPRKKRSFIMRTLVLIVLAWALGNIGFLLREQAPPDVPWEGAQFVDLASGRTHYIDVGPRNAPVILLFHGSGRGIADWQEGLAQALSSQYRVIGFDYFGNGFSEHSHGLSYGYDLWAKQGVELLDELGIKRATFVGHSVGGVVAAAAAADYRGHADGLVTIGTGSAIDPAQILPLFPGLGEIMLAAQPNFSETLSTQHAEFINRAHNIRGSRHAYLVYIRRQYSIDGIRILRGLFNESPCDKLHISGTEDASVPFEAARNLAEETGGEFVAFEGIGHNVHVEKPAELARIISQFITRARTP